MFELLLSVPIGYGIWKYKHLKDSLSDYQLCVGYTSIYGFRYPIIIDMKYYPHVLICGLSNSGKTRQVEYMLKNKNCILINAFKNDYKTLHCPRVVGNENIYNFLLNIKKTICDGVVCDKPFYIVIDELLVLSQDKKIANIIFDILSVGRHFNIYLICVSQIGNKEQLKFKDLFNVRICFRVLDDSAFKVVLGVAPIGKNLFNRQFYIVSNSLIKGKTYFI